MKMVFLGAIPYRDSYKTVLYNLCGVQPPWPLKDFIQRWALSVFFEFVQ